MALISSSLIFFLLLHFHLLLALPEPDPVPVQSLLPTPQMAPPATIQAFPEQFDIATACPLELPNELFHHIGNACGGKARSGQLRRSQCCPVLAAWVYAAYSNTALGRAVSSSNSRISSSSAGAAASPYDLPVLPDDSETCVDNLEKSFKGKGIELRRPNETCDVVYCYCGIRLHPLTCPEAFSVSNEGKLVGDANVKNLERDCLNKKKNGGGYSSLSGCNKCLKTLNQLKNPKNARNTTTTSSDKRKTKMHNTDCELMGLTWLLSKNRTAYMPTVTSVLRALMMNPAGGSDPRSCSLTSDGLPIAVDSADLDDNQSSSSNVVVQSFMSYSLSSICLLYVCIIVFLHVRL